MQINGIRIDNSKVQIDAYYLSINREYGVPSDSAEVVAIYNDKIGDLKGIYITDNNRCIFSGIVDVQRLICSDNKNYISIEARSMAGILLDNEAQPSQYNNADLLTILDRHIKDCGVAEVCHNNVVLSGNFDVTKGMSQWQVLNNFCQSTGLGTPSVSADNKIYFNLDSTISFGKGNIEYYYISLAKKRCNVVSDVYIKCKGSLSYDRRIKNNFADKMGIRARRYLDISQDSQQSIDVANQIIDMSNKNYCSIEVKCDKFVDAIPNQRADLSDKLIGNFKNLVVNSVRYTYNNGKEVTEIELKGDVTDVDN